MRQLRASENNRTLAEEDDVATRYHAPRLYAPIKAWDHNSVSSMASSRSSFSRLSAQSILSRSSSVTSYSSSFFAPSYETVPTLTKTPWELERSKRPASRKSRPTSSSILPAHFFDSLPREVYDCVLQQLEILHLSNESESCETCHLRDLHSLALTSRKWDRAARVRLYSTVWIPSTGCLFDSKKSKLKLSSRVKLLRRTLQERAALAKIVKELRTTNMQRLYEQANPKTKQEILDTLASLVTACPNLEKLTGFHLTYTHELDRLTHALSTRKNLKEHVWLLRGTGYSWEKWDFEDYYHGECPSAPEPPDPSVFLQCHESWPNLHTLVLHGNGAGSLDYRTLVGTFRRLPALQHLVISHFTTDDFNDRTLQAMPALQSLRLEDLPGLTDKGLLRFASSEAARGLRNLSLVDLEIMFLPVLSKFLANLSSLKRFTLVQDASPGLPPGAVVSKPAFRSQSVEFIHWDVLIPGTANEDLASSIEAGAFPKLRKIRAPSDHDGLIQKLCKPMAQIVHASDCYVNDPTLQSETRYLRSLPAARRAAQERIERARRRPATKIVVEEEGRVHHVYNVGSFIGRLGSQIEYSLESDIKGSRNAIAGVLDLTTRGTTAVFEQTCNGSWNDKHLLGRSWWQHTPRECARPMPLKLLF